MIARPRLSLLGRGLLLRKRLSTGSEGPIQSFFELFPKNFSHGGPPADSFVISPKALRREYRTLQSENHPDVLFGSSVLNSSNSDASFSTIINRAYTTLKNPYSRIAHLIQLNHPEHLDITKDEVSKDLIAKFQSQSPESSQEYKNMLMMVLEAHESLELAENESELEETSIENDERIKNSEVTIDKLLQQHWPISDWDSLMMEAIRLKYWVNIQNAIKDWEPGKPVHLTH